MSKRETYEKKTEELILPFIEANGFELVDVEYVKEGADWYLRVYIDKEGGITVNDCELISRAFNEVLDREDYIDDAYIFEVSSPGLLRPLKKDKDYERNLGRLLEIKLFAPLDGVKEFEAELKSYDKENATFVMDDEKEVTIKRSEISLIRPAIEF
ncbi:MAG: ribosome maturation factor RimP [Bacteroides sp.]